MEELILIFWKIIHGIFGCSPKHFFKLKKLDSTKIKCVCIRCEREHWENLI